VALRAPGHAVTEPVFILTAELDAENFAWLDGLRRAHFPPERNVLSAHLTMFHRLSPSQVACLHTVPLPAEPIPLQFDRVMFLGFGNAIGATSPELERLRADVKAAIGDGLSRQDDQRWTPHVTIQNKTTADNARALYAAFSPAFQPRSGSVRGLDVFEYLGGPWRLMQSLTFGKARRT
jgi:2'-5' RNA ligase